jgi:hypothetical protein
MKRQQKHYTVAIGTVDSKTDFPGFGAVKVQATDALAAARAVEGNLGKRQYVAQVTFGGFVEAVAPAPATVTADAPPAAQDAAVAA